MKSCQVVKMLIENHTLCVRAVVWRSPEKPQRYFQHRAVSGKHARDLPFIPCPGSAVTEAAGLPAERHVRESVAEACLGTWLSQRAAAGRRGARDTRHRRRRRRYRLEHAPRGVADRVNKIDFITDALRTSSCVNADLSGDCWLPWERQIQAPIIVLVLRMLETLKKMFSDAAVRADLIY